MLSRHDTCISPKEWQSGASNQFRFNTRAVLKAKEENETGITVKKKYLRKGNILDKMENSISEKQTRNKHRHYISF